MKIIIRRSCVDVRLYILKKSIVQTNKEAIPERQSSHYCSIGIIAVILLTNTTMSMYVFTALSLLSTSALT